MPRKKTATETAEDINTQAEELERATARLKKAQRARAKLEETDPDAIEEVEALPGSDVIGKIMQELDGEGSFNIYKMTDGQSVSIGSYGLVENWEDIVRDVIRQKGGGLYKFQFRSPEGVIVKTISRTYDPITAPTAVTPAPGLGGDVQALVAAMIKTADDRSARAEQAAENLRMELAKQQAANQATLLEFIKGSQGGFLKEVAPHIPSIIALLKLFFENKRDPLDDIANTLEIIDGLKEKAVEPAGVWDKLGATLASAIAPATAAALGGALGARRAKPAASADPKASLPAAASPTPAAPKKVIPTTAVTADAPKVEAAPAKTAGATEMKFPLIEYVDYILKAIAAGMTPGAFAQELYKSFEAKGQESILITLVDSGDWPGLMADQRVAAHAQWIQEVHDKLDSIIEESEEPENAPSIGS